MSNTVKHRIGYQWFEFAVYDRYGRWGRVRYKAVDQEAAESACRDSLIRRFCDGRGSLEMPFCLELRPMKIS